MYFRKRKAQLAMANIALADARENLRRTTAKNPEVNEVVRALKILREKNHFAEHLEVIMIGGRR